MRILFSGFPARGHILPLLPLARALYRRGDEVALLTEKSYISVLADENFEVLPAGAPVHDVFNEVTRRTGVDLTPRTSGQAENVAITPDVVAELFGGARVDLTIDDALDAARDWRPDLIISEVYDYVGPLVATALDVPTAVMLLGPSLPSEFFDAMATVVEDRYTARGLTQRPPKWFLDICPPTLQVDHWQAPQGRLPLRPEAHRAPDATDPVSVARRSPSEDPKVLVTFGTEYVSPEVLSPILRELSTSGLELKVTTGLLASATDFDVDHSKVTFVQFEPLDELLSDVDAVVLAGGAGSTLASLAAGLPLVVIPQGADQFVQATQVAASGAGLALMPGSAAPQAVSKALDAVLTDPSFRANARKVADEIAAMPSPDDVAATITEALEQHRARD